MTEATPPTSAPVETPAPPAGRSLLRRLAAGLALGFVAVLALLLLGDIRQVGREVLAFDWRLFPLALLLTLFNYTLRGLKWHFYIHQVGARGYPLASSAACSWPAFRWP
jgi:hypothetical protein